MKQLNKLEPVGLDFFGSAPLRVQCTLVAKCTPEVLFETLRGDTVWTEWAGVKVILEDRAALHGDQSTMQAAKATR